MTAIRHCENFTEAQVLADFLWNEKERHVNDIMVLLDDLQKLKDRWGVTPRGKKEFIKP